MIRHFPLDGNLYHASCFVKGRWSFEIRCFNFFRIPEWGCSENVPNPSVEGMQRSWGVTKMRKVTARIEESAKFPGAAAVDVPHKETLVGGPPLDQVDLWWENIDNHEAGISELWRILTEAERDRVKRFRLAKHQRRFIFRHGMLREILSRYLKMAPEEVRFRNGPDGKPAVAGEDPMIRFNLSDSGGYTLYAVAFSREVGVDVEMVRPKPKAAALVKRFFSANENAAFQKLGADERVCAFFAGWTRKEAYVKAIGKGLRFPLDRFDVSLKSGDQNALLNVAGASNETNRWVLQDIDLGPDFRAALAVEIGGKCAGKDISIRFRRYHL